MNRMKTIRPKLTCTLIAAGLTGLVSLTGCGGPPRHGPPLSEDRPEASAPRPTLLQGEQPFFGGRVLARLIVTRGFGHGAPGGPHGDGAPKHRPGGGGGGMMGGAGGPPPGGMGGGGMGGPPPGGGEMGGGESVPAQPRMMGASGPGLRVQLQLLDHGHLDAQPITIEILDFQSPLGDFALKPDRLALVPGQTASPDAVTSRVGIAAAEIPVQLTLRLAGEKEARTILLRAGAAPQPAQSANVRQ